MDNINRKINLTVHASASYFGNSVLIDNWHRHRNPPFREIGYHFVILNGWINSKWYNPFFDGKVESGRAFSFEGGITGNERGAHVLGHNNDSLGICMIGNSSKFTAKQLNSLIDVYVDCTVMFNQYGFDVEYSQHSELDPTRKPLCAGLDMRIIRDRVYHRLDSKSSSEWRSYINANQILANSNALKEN